MLTSILVFGNDKIPASVSIKRKLNMYGSSLVHGYDLQSVGQLQNVQSDRHYHYKLQVDRHHLADRICQHQTLYISYKNVSTKSKSLKLSYSSSIIPLGFARRLPSTST